MQAPIAAVVEGARVPVVVNAEPGSAARLRFPGARQPLPTRTSGGIPRSRVSTAQLPLRAPQFVPGPHFLSLGAAPVPSPPALPAPPAHRPTAGARSAAL